VPQLVRVDLAGVLKKKEPASETGLAGVLERKKKRRMGQRRVLPVF